LVCFCVKKNIGSGRVEFGCSRQFYNAFVVTSVPLISTFILIQHIPIRHKEVSLEFQNLRYVVTIAFIAKMMDYSIKFVSANCLFLLARYLYQGLYLDNVINFCKVHQALTENKPL